VTPHDKGESSQPAGWLLSRALQSPDDAATRQYRMAWQTKSRSFAMTKLLLNCSVRAAVAVLCLGATIHRTTAGSFTRGCAARDLQILMLVEQWENTNAISAERLSDAMLTMMNARMLCRDGYEADALRMYDSVTGILTPSFNRRMLPLLSQP
jgi:hypothetical protein